MVLLAVVPTKLIQLCATAHRLIPVTTLSLTAGSLTRVQICRAAPLSVVGKIVPVPFGLVGVEDLDEAVVTVLVSCYVGVTRPVGVRRSDFKWKYRHIQYSSLIYIK